MIYTFLIILLLIFYQDLKDRQVTFVILLLGIILGSTIYYGKTIHQLFFLNIIANFSFLLVIIGLLLLYTRFKMKVSFFESIGWGDILFFTLLALSFPTIIFLLLFSLSLVFSLLIYRTLKTKLDEKTVPLAGFQALFLFLILFINLIFNFVNLYAM